MIVKLTLTFIVMVFADFVYADIVMPEPLHRIGFEVLVYVAGAVALGGGFVWKLKRKIDESGWWKTEDMISHHEKEDIMRQTDENFSSVQRVFEGAYETALARWMEEDRAREPSFVFPYQVNRMRRCAWKALQQQLLMDVLSRDEALIERFRGVPIEWLCGRLSKPMPDDFTAGVFGENRLLAGRYRVIRQLDQGGKGEVQLCLDEITRIRVIVENLPYEMTRNQDSMDNVRRQFERISQLYHPGIAVPRSLEKKGDGFLKDDWILVADYVTGDSLEQWRRKFPDHKVPLENAIEVARQIADALDYAHVRKVFHRNLKSSNVKIETTHDGAFVARVLDFSLDEAMHVSSKLEDCYFKSPEQRQGAYACAQSDQYSLGVLVYEMIAGRLPWFSDDIEYSVKTVPLPIVGGIGPVDNVCARTMTDKPLPVVGVPAWINDALVRAMAKNPDERFRSCSDFVEALTGETRAKSFGEWWWSLWRRKS